MRSWSALLGTLSACLFLPMALAATDYTVVDGDNIQAIADKMGVPIQEVLDANTKLRDPNKIWAGMILKIPESSPLARGEAVPTKLPDVETVKKKDLPKGWRSPQVVREGVPEGLLRLKGVTWRSSLEQWDLVIPDCGEDTCQATLTVENIGETRVEGLSVDFSTWYYMAEADNDCGPLDPGQQCDITVKHTAGYTRRSPGMVIVQASDAFIRPPDPDVIWFYETVFWVCAAADDKRCLK